MEKKYNKWSVDLIQTKPALEVIKDKFFQDSEILSIEKIDEEALIWLDQYSGIDWIEKNEDNQLTTIAARIQWDHNWQTFTIRSKRHTGNRTELSKRKEAIKKGYLYPTFTLQAYFKHDPLKLLSCCMLKTTDLYEFMRKHSKWVYERKSDNLFKFVNWEDLKIWGIKFYIQYPTLIKKETIDKPHPTFFD